jgi:hypothetical protein
MNSVTHNSEEEQYAAINPKTLIQDCKSQEDCSEPEDGVAASSFMKSANCLS